MARIIFISEYLRGGKQASRLANRTRYFATRPGVEKLPDEKSDELVTDKQRAYIQRLVRSFPTAKELLEYEDYVAKPSRGNAQEFIDQVHELYIDMMDDRENLMDYMANRPGVQTYGNHGLWDANGKVPVLSRAVEEVANHPGIVWTPVVSIRREDAERLGYNDAENWRALVNAVIPDIAKGYKIKVDNLRWYAAFHRKDNQVHIHMVVFSTDPKEGYLTKQGIREVKSAFARQIFRQDLISVYEKQTEYRNQLQRDAQSLMTELISQMANGTLENEKLIALTTELAKRLQNTTSKKVYGYLPATSKRLVDAIVDELSKDERIAAAYRLWYEMQDEKCRTYNEKPPERIPLSQQKEFKPVRNMVIRETLRLIEESMTFDDAEMDDEPEMADEEDAHTPESVYVLADRYRMAKKVLQTENADPVEKSAACRELEQLWEKGYSIAAHQLGKVFRDGLVDTEDLVKAELWFRRSAEAGNDCSEYALGKMLLDQKRTDEALRWLEKAADHGNQFARYRLGKLYLSGDGVTKDVEKALEYLTASAKQGNQFAQYTLGKLYLLGQEVQQDKEQAIEWLTRSAAQGNPYAQYFLNHQDDFQTASVGNAVIRMLHHMSRIFRENMAAGDAYTGLQIDRKRRRKLQQKRIAMGHKADDHEEQLQHQPNL